MEMPMKTASSPGSNPQLFLMILACCATPLCEQACLAAPSVVGLWRFNESSGTNAARPCWRAGCGKAIDMR
jgi:hypothetical protein